MNSLVLGFPTGAPSKTVTDNQCAFSNIFTTLRAEGLETHPSGTTLDSLAIDSNGIIARGGASPSSLLDAKGQLITFDGSGTVAFNPGTVGQVLSSNPSTADGLKWITLNPFQPSTTKGNILTGNGSTYVNLGVGTKGQTLTADSTSNDGLRWKTYTPPGKYSVAYITNMQANPNDGTQHNTFGDQVLGFSNKVYSMVPTGLDDGFSSGIGWTAPYNMIVDFLIEVTGAQLASNGPGKWYLISIGSDGKGDGWSAVKLPSIEANKYDYFQLKTTVTCGAAENFYVCCDVFGNGQTDSSGDTAQYKVAWTVQAHYIEGWETMT